MKLKDDAISLDTKLANQFQSLISSGWKSQALYVAAELGIADHLASGPHHSAEIAEVLGADQQCLQRLLWALSALGVCAERENGNFELTDLGALLQASSPQSLRASTLWWGRYLWPCGAISCTASGRAKALASIYSEQRNSSTSRTIQVPLPSSIG